MLKENTRTLESLNYWFWSNRFAVGCFVWGWSRDWKSIHPWSEDGVNIPYISYSSRPYKAMNRHMITLGPIMIQVGWM